MKSNSRQDRERPTLRYRRLAVIVLILLGGWLFTSYLLVSHFTDKRLETTLHRYSTELKQTTEAVTYHFERSVSFLHVVPETIGDNREIAAALGLIKRQSSWSRSTPDERRKYLNSRQDMLEINQHLTKLQKDLGLDVIWVMDPDGNCVISSNFDRPESFVGINYSDRLYFKSALAGQRGKQYAVGRQTNIPGLFFSAPIYYGAKVIGVVTVKIDIAKLSKWFNRFNCFVTDKAGVIILSTDKSFEHRALADAPVFKMTAEARDKQYKQVDFPVMEIGTFGDRFPSYSAITLPESDTPYMLARNQLITGDYTIFTYLKVVEIEQLRTVKAEITILLFISGAALLLLLTGFRRYLHDAKVARETLAAKQTQLEILNNSLQERVSEALAELRQRDQMLIAQSRQAAMGEMIGNIAHQWRQPLNALAMVLGNINSAHQYNDLTAEYLKTAFDKGNQLIQKMSTTINDFRNFFLPDKESVSFSANSQINHALSLVEAGLNSQNIKIHLEADSEMQLTGLPNEYSQVILNLLSNAREAIKENNIPEGFIKIRLFERDGFACVSVSDNGGGIPVDVINNIFEPYFSTKEMGTGIGLYMSKMIIERSMKGTIEVRNIDGGAEFVVSIPQEDTL